MFCSMGRKLASVTMYSALKITAEKSVMWDGIFLCSADSEIEVSEQVIK
jgi:hypothetical protein